MADRMLGTLTRYLRFMGYDTVSANDLHRGNRREDSLLLERANREKRVLLTRDRELARRGGEKGAVWIAEEGVIEQVRQLIALGLVIPQLRMNRCSVCNHRLRRAHPQEITASSYAPDRSVCTDFYWCPHCHKLYWMGSHGSNLSQRLKELTNRQE
ncbi:MAG: Mut7-C RNAse domain-containing protein [Methanomicrobiales archaeon]|nr:Mut7-C RNAse domain-containing protein [Methanomicrobiales archaeon]